MNPEPPNNLDPWPQPYRPPWETVRREPPVRWLFGRQRYRAVPWTGWEVALLIPMVVSGIWRGMARQEIEKSQTFIAFNNLALFLMLALPFVVVLLRGAKWYQLGMHTSHCWRYAAIGFMAYFIAAPSAYLTNLYALRFFQRKPHAIEQALRRSPTVPHIVASAAMAVVIAPVLEELAFRGILLPWLRRTIGAWPGILVSSAIFAIAHFDAWPAPIALFVLAVFLGYLAHRSTSLIPSIVLHATFNAANLAILIVAIRFNQLD